MRRDYRLYLDDMLEASRRIREYMGDVTFESYLKDTKLLDAVVRNVEVIGEAASHVPDEIRKSNPDIEWKRIIGLRNIIAHEYFGIDYAVLWQIVKSGLTGLEEQVKVMLDNYKEY